MHINTTLQHKIMEAFIYSPDGKYLVFISAKSAVDSGAHNATNSLHRIEWCTDGKLDGSLGVADVDSDYSWNVLAVDKNNILAVSSSLITLPQMYYGIKVSQTESNWEWQGVSTPFPKPSDKISSVLAEHKFSILKIPISNPSDELANGAKLPFEAIFVSHKDSASNPTIVVLHGGPHSVYPSSYSKSLAFLFSQGYNLLVVNYRGSLGFGEEALQSLPGNIGSQDVNDVLTALDLVIKRGLIDPSRVAVVGGSHGGFLTTHLIGQAPDTFVAAAARNPVCNLSLMVGTSDIPDWCFVEIYGKEGKKYFSESPSVDDLCQFHQKSPISHIAKVKTPTLFLLGAQDLRVPVSNGLQYARALKERGIETKTIVFPEDIHGIDKPQSDFESFLNIGVWFKKHMGK
ncbi:Acylamino-acid-releasing enzyme [Zea mays]|uniref:acylaminoacyl-peptidase n=1 Tax=Zea mays TaxID=4577 RepID=A0A1D6KV20_MAIZE|nr:Acylamino-acid-releasing enzyme [Zea mays]